MHIFFTPDIQGDAYTLNEEESKHCSRVLRLKEGDRIQLVDGKGGFFEAEITDPHPKRTALKITRREEGFGKRNHYLHIAVAPTKNIDRLEWFLEKATEIGIDEVTPIICERSERKEVKTERLEKIVVSAMKQSLKAYLPKINPAISFSKFISDASADHQYIAHCVDSEKKAIAEGFQKGQSYLVLIGPEGDFSEKEIAEAFENAFLPVTLGNSRLRTETAALQACFEINYLNR